MTSIIVLIMLGVTAFVIFVDVVLRSLLKALDKIMLYVDNKEPKVPKPRVRWADRFEKRTTWEILTGKRREDPPIHKDWNGPVRQF